MKKLGVIGGLGPMATALFMEMVTEMTNAQSDQEHINMVIYSCPQIPDRTKFILGKSTENPLPLMKEIGRKLEDEKVNVIAIPCITASYFIEEFKQECSVPIIDILENVAIHLRENNVKTVGLMATDGTRKTGLFQKKLEQFGINTILPESKYQEQTMHIIYENVKAGKPIEVEMFKNISANLRSNGAEVIILGCTELSLARKEMNIGSGYLDAMQVLAKCAVEHCGKLKEEYISLITK